MVRALGRLEGQSPIFWTITGLLLVGFLGWVDFATGYEISFSLFYLLPIAMVTWYTNRRSGLVISAMSALTWLLAESAAGRDYSNPIFIIWNALIRFGFFVIVNTLISEVRRAQDSLRDSARTDFVSGAVNARHFQDLVQLEIDRVHRYRQPFTIAYIDLDDFKGINNELGHRRGDEIIRWVAAELKTVLRSTDIVARLGGDEYALLLPAAGQDEGRAAASKVHGELTERIRQQKWPLTLSIGAVIFLAAPESPDVAIQMADDLMYMVKNSTKNDIRFAAYNGNRSTLL